MWAERLKSPHIVVLLLASSSTSIHRYSCLWTQRLHLTILDNSQELINCPWICLRDGDITSSPVQFWDLQRPPFSSSLREGEAAHQSDSDWQGAFEGGGKFQHYGSWLCPQWSLSYFKNRVLWLYGILFMYDSMVIMSLIESLALPLINMTSQTTYILVQCVDALLVLIDVPLL